MYVFNRLKYPRGLVGALNVKANSRIPEERLPARGLCRTLVLDNNGLTTTAYALDISHMKDVQPSTVHLVEDKKSFQLIELSRYSRN